MSRKRLPIIFFLAAAKQRYGAPSTASSWRPTWLFAVTARRRFAPTSSCIALLYRPSAVYNHRAAIDRVASVNKTIAMIWRVCDAKRSHHTDPREHVLFLGPARAQVNYELFPGHGSKAGFPPIVNYHAWITGYRDNKFYNCTGSYDVITPRHRHLFASQVDQFNPPLLSGANVKTFRALGTCDANNDEARSGIFCQIGRVTGQTQFRMHGVPINCVAVQIPRARRQRVGPEA